MGKGVQLQAGKATNKSEDIRFTFYLALFALFGVHVYHVLLPKPTQRSTRVFRLVCDKLKK